jgi:thiol-disulfide isomerase/thioredoxin
MTFSQFLTAWSRGITAAVALAAAAISPMATADEAPRVELPRLRAADGRDIDLSAPANGVCVLVFYSPDCPISNAYSPTLARLAESFPEKSMKLVGICADFDLSDADVSTHARDFSLKFPVARDIKGLLATRLGAKVTPEAFVIDAKSRLRYHGRIDDQYVARRKRNEHAKTRELHDAITAVLEGHDVAVSYVPAVGCPIPKPPQ